MIVVNLPHDVVCSESRCYCSRQVTGVTDHDPATGAKTVRALHRKLAGSITLTAAGHDGDKLENLPLGVARLADVLALEKSRKVRVTRHANEKHTSDQLEQEKAKAAAEKKVSPPSPRSAPSALVKE